MFVTKNKVSPYCWAFFFDDDSMFTGNKVSTIQPFSLKDAIISFQPINLHAYPKTSYLKSKIILEGKKIKII